MNDTTAPRSTIYTDCLKTIDLDGNIRAMDEGGMCLMEIDDFQTVAGQPWPTLWPAESRFLVEEAIKRASKGTVARFNADCPTAKGTMKSWEVLVTPIRNDAGEIVAIQSVSLDVSQREHDRRESALVSRELSHRMKNLFAVVDSIIHLSSRSQPEALPFVKTLRERLGGLGRAISFINPMGEDDLDAAPQTVKGLIDSLLVPYRDAGGKVVVSGDDAPIGKDAVTSLSLVLNELATNAVKYGALKDAAGHLGVVLERTPDHLGITWTESGVKFVIDPDLKSGFGTLLLNRTVHSQLSGTIEREWLDNGLKVHLNIPMKRLA